MRMLSYEFVANMCEAIQPNCVVWKPAKTGGGVCNYRQILPIDSDSYQAVHACVCRYRYVRNSDIFIIS